MKEVIHKCWFDGFNRRDWDSVQKIYSEDALVHGKEGELRGGASVVKLAKAWLRAIPDAYITPLYTSIEQDVVVVHWRAEGSFIHPIKEIAATGKQVVFHGLTCFRCQHGKVIEHWASVDYRPLSSASST